ncbi:MAG: LytTR family DNA-binding domain-containing protein [Gammaproteobacteria bacterium]|nr:LytTR family DNA-binding domain-containing protein [Gammaproteobacteria bacterium]MBU1555135.1 LytTR family DNA-binding domain-containing protein [Gammaproteobacteria bacterium]
MIVEDSRLARLELKEQLKAHSQLQLVGEAADVPSALSLIQQHQPDLLLLDIDLCGASAFDLLAQLEAVPKIIFTTAYAEHALTAFDYPTVDYLLKPVTAERLATALAKLSAIATAPASEQQTADNERILDGNSNFFVKDGERCYLLKISDVRWFEAIGNYSKVHAGQQAPMVYRSLNSIEQRLMPGLFFRANRHQLVNLTAIYSVEPSVSGGFMLQLRCGTEVAVSRRQSTVLRQQLAL